MSNAQHLGSIRLAPAGPKVAGRRELEKVEIVRNNQTVASFTGDGLTVEEEWTDSQPLEQVEPLGEPGAVFYYVRVTQRDRRMAWSSPIWIESS